MILIYLSVYTAITGKATNQLPITTLQIKPSLFKYLFNFKIRQIYSEIDEIL